jgi:hypothetical protein
MEYTEQEIEMLARFDVARYDADDWTTCSDDDKAKDRKAVLAELMSDNCSAVLRAAARLMRAAREQGAAEMRKQVIAALRALPDGTWGDERGEMSPWPDAIAAVEALRVPQ